jgi:hypothetical protein
MPSDIVFVITLYGPGGQHMLGAAGGGIPVRVRVSDADGESAIVPLVVARNSKL